MMRGSGIGPLSSALQDLQLEELKIPINCYRTEEEKKILESFVFKTNRDDYFAALSLCFDHPSYFTDAYWDWCSDEVIYDPFKYIFSFFREASLKKDPNRIKRFIVAEQYMCDSDISDLLLCAVYANDYLFARFIIHLKEGGVDKYASFADDGKTLLHHAIDHENIDMIKYLIMSGMDSNRSLYLKLEQRTGYDLESISTYKYSKTSPIEYASQIFAEEKFSSRKVGIEIGKILNPGPWVSKVLMGPEGKEERTVGKS